MILRKAALVAVLVWSSPAVAGWVIEEAVKGRDGASREQTLVQANRIKWVSWRPDGQPGTSTILDLDAQRITQVSHPTRSYASGPIRELVETLHAAMAQLSAEMEAQLKELPAEQRRMMEQMMRSQGPQACRPRRLDVRRTAQQATVAGHAAVRYEVRVEGKLDSELWIASTIAAWEELDRAKLEQASAQLDRIAGCGPGSGRRGFGASGPAMRLASEGYPVRTVDRSGGGETAEVIRAERRAIPHAEFEPPTVFHRKTFKEMMTAED